MVSEERRKEREKRRERKSESLATGDMLSQARFGAISKHIAQGAMFVSELFHRETEDREAVNRFAVGNEMRLLFMRRSVPTVESGGKSLVMHVRTQQPFDRSNVVDTDHGRLDGSLNPDPVGCQRPSDHIGPPSVTIQNIRTTAVGEQK